MQKIMINLNFIHCIHHFALAFESNTDNGVSKFNAYDIFSVIVLQLITKDSLFVTLIVVKPSHHIDIEKTAPKKEKEVSSMILYGYGAPFSWH